MSTTAGKLFGTDGIRGTSNQYPMTPEIVVKVGQAIGYLIRKKRISSPSQMNRVVIGKDTRLSGYMIEQALSSGLNSMGIYVQLVGPLPTPGIGYLTRTMRAAAGIVISLAVVGVFSKTIGKSYAYSAGICFNSTTGKHLLCCGNMIVPDDGMKKIIGI